MKGIKKMKEIEKEICEICGKELSKEEINEFDGKILLTIYNCSVII